MKLLISDFYQQATERFVESLERAAIDFQHLTINYDGFLPAASLLNPFAAATGSLGMTDKALHYNEIQVPELYEIRNESGSRATILNGATVVGYVVYAPNTSRLVKEVQWLDAAGKLVLAERYNRQGFKFAEGMFNAEQKEVKTLYYTAGGRKVLTLDHVTRALISEIDAQPVVYENLTGFVVAYIRGLQLTADELIFNSLSTPFFVSNALTELPGTLYFQEGIGKEIPGNMQSILEGKTATRRILFENAKELAKVEKLTKVKKVALDYLGTIEAFSRDNTFRPAALTLTRSDQILYDEAIATTLAAQGIIWTIAAPSEVSDKLRTFAGKHDNVKIREAIRLTEIDDLLADNDIYLDLNQGTDTANAVQRAYLEGLLVVGDKTVLKNPGYELVLEKEAEITGLLARPDKAIALKVLREKRGKPATVSDYQAAFK